MDTNHIDSDGKRECQNPTPQVVIRLVFEPSCGWIDHHIAKFGLLGMVLMLSLSEGRPRVQNVRYKNATGNVCCRSEYNDSIAN